MFESKVINDEIRASFPGKSARLSKGSVYYQLEGPENGELVVLIHGMSIPSFIWDPTSEILTREGFRVLRYDLYGRGFSDRPKAEHNIDLFTSQLLELLDALQLVDGKATLVGFSMGAGIAAAFTVNHPDKIQKICFIDPSHPEDMPAAPLRIFKTLIKLKRHNSATIKSIINGLSNNFYNYENFPNFEKQFSEQLEFKGYAHAMIATLVDFKFYALPEIYEQIGELEIPVCLFWGEEDRLAEFERVDSFKAHIPSIQFHPIEKAGHLSHYERPDIVNPLLLDFLKN